jgi:hypothetical protein
MGETIESAGRQDASQKEVVESCLGGASRSEAFSGKPTVHCFRSIGIEMRLSKLWVNSRTLKTQTTAFFVVQ